MKKQVSPMVVVAIIAVVVLVAGFFLWRGTGAGPAAETTPTGMPPDVAAEFQKRMGGTTPPVAPTGQPGSR